MKCHLFLTQCLLSKPLAKQVTPARVLCLHKATSDTKAVHPAKCGLHALCSLVLTNVKKRARNMKYQNPMSGCSKALRGLSVQSQVTCIFTGISISPGPSLRQRPNRYTIRAGRNLPDKEFRYLRTVIVTAAVHWGFGSKLWFP